MSVLVNFAIFPTDKGTSVSKEVSEVLKTIINSGFDYNLNAMGTVFETKTMEQALQIIQEAYNVLKQHERVYLVVNMDIQKNKDGRILTKIQSVENKLKTRS
ncbi:MAG: thiamine-binding protein [Bacteroidales bacterium]|nr:thiamine-binding protein [Bacteroidales bacterium]RLD37525.1 MAG: thiamine-binding protein [Bacteroidota bacterium]